MRAVSIVGIGQAPAMLDSRRSAGDLAASALGSALADAGLIHVQALFISSLSCEHDPALLASFGSGLPGVEVRCVAPACGGGAALHSAVQAVASGVYDVVAVTGVESTMSQPQAASADEAEQGLTAAVLDALILRRYLYEYSWKRLDLAPFAINARHNALSNRYAALHSALTLEQYQQAPATADPMTALDSAPLCTGAASVVLCPTEMATTVTRQPVSVTASVMAADTPALHDRADVLWLHASHSASKAAYAQAGISAGDVDFFELHDASTIMAVLSLEAAGFAEQGSGVRLGQDGAIACDGAIPISTFGGLLARGDAGAASGLYQAVEAVLQLRHAAGANQVAGARVGLIQSMAGSGACVATHILQV